MAAAALPAAPRLELATLLPPAPPRIGSAQAARFWHPMFCAALEAVDTPPSGEPVLGPPPERVAEGPELPPAALEAVNTPPSGEPALGPPLERVVEVPVPPAAGGAPPPLRQEPSPQAVRADELLASRRTFNALPAWVRRGMRGTAGSGSGAHD